MSDEIKIDSGTPDDELVEKRYRDYTSIERELKEVKQLIGLAADRIEWVTYSLDFVHKSVWEAHEIPELIAELRKAAE